jgi:hypothetical protein
MTIIEAAFLSLSITLFIEIIVAIPFAIKHKYVIPSVILVNLITQPILSLITLQSIIYSFKLNVRSYNAYYGGNNLYLLEILVILIEWLLLSFALTRTKKTTLLFMSVLMNTASYFAGLLMQFFIIY